MPKSNKDYEKEAKKREGQRTELLNAHLREIQRKKADAYNIGSTEYEGDSITSKTDLGRMTSSRHPKTSVINHVWHDTPEIHTEGQAANRSRGNSQMRDNKTVSMDHHPYAKKGKVNAARKLS